MNSDMAIAVATVCTWSWVFFGVCMVGLRWVERAPDRVSGAWVFRGTRVPVSTLFENIESGARVEDFVAWFPGVRHEQVGAVLAHAARSLTAA